MRNIELKARLRDRAQAETVCKKIGAALRDNIRQIDTYFRTPSGRLKLREAVPGRTELVYYHRPDVAGPKGCDYELEPVNPSIKNILSHAFGVLVTVDKMRALYLWEQHVRIHLDKVQGLGEFIEFEAIQDDKNDEAVCRKKLERLIKEFGLQPDDMFRRSYLEIAQDAAKD